MLNWLSCSISWRYKYKACKPCIKLVIVFYQYQWMFCWLGFEITHRRLVPEWVDKYEHILTTNAYKWTTHGICVQPTQQNVNHSISLMLLPCLSVYWTHWWFLLFLWTRNTRLLGNYRLASGDLLTVDMSRTCKNPDTIVRKHVR